MAINRGYLTLAEAKKALDITDNVDDQTIERLVEATSRMIDNYCGRSFVLDTTTKLYTATDPYFVRTDNYANSPTTIYIDADNDGVPELEITGVTPLPWPPNNGTDAPYTGVYLPKNSPVTFPVGDVDGPPNVAVVATYGWNNYEGDNGIPEPVKTACAIQLGTVYRSREAVFGVIGSNETGVVRMSSRLHPEAQLLLDPYRRRLGLAF